MTEAGAVGDFVGAVDRMIREHDAWSIDDQTQDNKPPDALLDACTDLFQVARKAVIHGWARKLFTAVEQFEQACQAFTSGMAQKRSGEPVERFWTTLRDVIHERRRVRDLAVGRRLESVATLRRQKVSDIQIARQIYGHRGVGPFLDADGRIMHELIDKEEKQPGSVVPADWVHPAEAERFSPTIGAKEATVEPESNCRKGPPTIEGMLRDGADVKEICAACNVKPQTVRTIAEILHIPIPEHAEEVTAEK